ncbi:MAG: threonyl-tRNA synthetase [Parcubacteria group bacterium Greene0416_79]|nr:MAG: threonyl-tRNA synthetase [Parcubacteria group bacterium Greene0416_79]
MPATEQLPLLRHSLAHLLAAAVRDLYPDAKPTIGPAIDNGFYYDFDFTNADTRGTERRSTQISETDLPKIEEKMREIVKHWVTFAEIPVTADEARKIFNGNPYKLELIDEIEKKGERITVYYSGPKKDIPEKSELLRIKDKGLRIGFIDLCKGGHAENLREMRDAGWKLDRIAGAYWRGDEKNKMLTRIYGLAFESKKELDEYLTEREDAKKRDHKKLGRELDLFTFSELVGGGLPLWTPKGTLMRDILDTAVWELRKKFGYTRVDIPHITKKDLYEKSGHWEKFKNELFHIKTREKHELVVKPMNCPHHIEIFKRKAWSYRELPERYASTTKVYRDEQTGELAGLSRVRAITQDDAHVFCRHSQIKKEMNNIWEIIESFYGRFGFTLTPRVSLHDPENMGAYLGDAEVWEKAEGALRGLVNGRGAQAAEAIGEAAFYGPKIDFLAKDSLGREWQVATIQLDMSMPERFNLVCTGENGKEERIAMIHAAIMGSIERFIGILIEHYAGAFPAWLAPVQVKILPVSEKFLAYARKIHEELISADIRSELDTSNETLGKKVRAAKLEKVPYWIVVGEKETTKKVVSLEHRDGKKDEGLNLQELTAMLEKEVRNKK